MKVPKYIEDKMRKIVRLNNVANKEMTELELWLEERGIDTSVEGELRTGDGIGLDELEYGNGNAIVELCERIESLL